MTRLTWDSNPFAQGVIHARIQGRKAAIGAVGTSNERVTGSLLGETIYIGDSEKEAMSAVEIAINKLSPHVIEALKD